MTHKLTESDAEEAALDILRELGYDRLYGPDIAPAPDGRTPERSSYCDVVLRARLEAAIDRLNPAVPKEAREEAVKRVLRLEGRDLLTDNQIFHRFLVNGVDVEYKREGSVRGTIVKLFDWSNPKNNEFLAVNQFTVIENGHNRRPDVVVFVNGLPLAVIELKNPAEEKATIWSAFSQFQTYKEEIPSIFKYNEILVATDGTYARSGTLTSGREWFLPWRTIDGKGLAPKSLPEMQVLLEGMFERRRFLDILRHFIVFKKDGKKTSKVLAAYHQYHATTKAIDATLKATRKDKRCGVVWHTQGSGKSLTMAFYAGKLVVNEEMGNPTLVVLTDRNDLDDQLFNTFSAAKELLRQDPTQADSREDLKKKLNVASGGVVFTTIQKFFPEKKGDKYPTLSDRRNIIVIADEAHRSQYDFIDGFARHIRDALPNASFIGFTGTPIELSDRSTPAVFGNYIDIYDIRQAVEDNATVRIYYESRLAKLELKTEERPKIDPDFEEITESEEAQIKTKLKSKWARLEAIVGSEKRIKTIAKDIVQHLEQREKTIEGKAMIVCMSRRICIDLYNEIVKLRPDWHNKDDQKGKIKVIMTGSASDPVGWQQHIRNKLKRRELGDRFKDPAEQFKIAIVRDMWLTGFDVPSLHTLYLDKPMKAHGLMQAIARVNRVYKDKPGGLVVDYLGVAEELKYATATYTKSGGKGKPVSYQEEAIAKMLENYEIVQNLFHGFNYDKFFKGTAREKLAVIPAAIEHILKQKDGKKRYLDQVTALSKAFALAVPSEKALEIRDDVGFFQAVRSALAKATSDTGKTGEELDTAIKQLVSKAITTDKVVDIFEASGLQKPDISILSDEFLAEIEGLEYKNLALETLRKLLNDEIRSRAGRNITEGRKFSEMLEGAIRKYQNRSLEAAKVIEELIKIAKELRESQKRGEELNLNEDELAFYDALADNESAKEVLGDETLQKIAKEITDLVKKNTSIDWSLRDSVRSKLKVLVKRSLRKYGYPPDKQEKATELVIKQAELVSQNWAASS